MPTKSDLNLSTMVSQNIYLNKCSVHKEDNSTELGKWVYWATLFLSGAGGEWKSAILFLKTLNLWLFKDFRAPYEPCLYT